MNSENKLVIEQINKFGKVPQRHELLQMIERLEQENKKLSENYDRIYNENCKLREEHNITDISLLDENYNLKDNWNKLKEYCKENTLCYEVGDDENTKLIGSKIHGLNVLDKMQELEQGSDNK